MASPSARVAFELMSALLSIVKLDRFQIKELLLQIVGGVLNVTQEPGNHNNQGKTGYSSHLIPPGARKGIPNCIE